ncbi:MAG: LD-carboxypeptidase, partial [Planctomycetales bacterium]|nr:LD-carboxypeptidase [Planctomycetales bacterium]
QRVELAAQRLREMGLNVIIPATAYRADGYLAGADGHRAAELMSAFERDDVQAVFPGTGGYGSMRILDALDFAKIRQHPKVFVGFSDITALHIAIHQRTGLVTFHSPNPIWGLGSDTNLSPLSAHWFWRAIHRNAYRPPHGRPAEGYLISATLPTTNLAQLSGDSRQLDCGAHPPITLVGGRARGELTGGNLSLVAATMGTPYEIDTMGKLLFLEDVGEAPYRVDRMLQTLQLAGKLKQAAGIVLGQFTRRDDEPLDQYTTTMEEVLTGHCKGLGIPVVMNFPVGHDPCNITLPVGIPAELDADGLTIRLLACPTR